MVWRGSQRSIAANTVNLDVPDYDQKSVVVAFDTSLDLSSSIKHCLGSSQGQWHPVNGEYPSSTFCLVNSLLMQDLGSGDITISFHVGIYSYYLPTGSEV